MRPSAKWHDGDGYTFIEVMVTLIILSLGIVTILKSFVVSMDQMRYLTNKIYASVLLDNKVAHIERMLRTQKALPFDLNQQDEVDIGSAVVEFSREMEITEVEDFVDVFKLDLAVTWEEGRRQKRMSRSAYISDFSFE